jgi:hypothetical protein
MSQFGYPTFTDGSAAASAAPAVAPIDPNALLGVLGNVATKVATFLIMNKDPNALTPADTALFLEANGGNDTFTNAISSGADIQSVLLQALSQQTYRTLQMATMTKALNQFAVALNNADPNTTVAQLKAQLLGNNQNNKPISPDFLKFLNLKLP